MLWWLPNPLTHFEKGAFFILYRPSESPSLPIPSLKQFRGLSLGKNQLAHPYYMVFLERLGKSLIFSEWVPKACWSTVFLWKLLIFVFSFFRIASHSIHANGFTPSSFFSHSFVYSPSSFSLTFSLNFQPPLFSSSHFNSHLLFQPILISFFSMHQIPT